MRLDRIDLNLFIVFEALYREGSVTRVAQQLHLTQPAVSNALGRLRRDFDDQLFVRTTRGMQPTPVAENAIADVRRALGLLQRSVGTGARFDPQTSEKTFRLGMNELVQSLLLPNLTAAVREAAPGVSLTAFYLQREWAEEELKAGDLDLLVDNPLVNARDLEQTTLATLTYVVAMRPGHPLAGKPLALEDYLAAEHLHVSSRPRGRGHADVALHALGLRRRVVTRVQSNAVAAAITANSDLLWTAPPGAFAGRDLVSSAPPFPVEPLTLHLFWTRSAADDPANQWMRGLIQAGAGDLDDGTGLG